MEEKHDKLSRELEQAHNEYNKLLCDYNEVFDMHEDLKIKVRKRRWREKKGI